jgi:hypothetical protein
MFKRSFALVVQRVKRLYPLWWFSDSSLWWFLERVYRLWFSDSSLLWVAARSVHDVMFPFSSITFHSCCVVMRSCVSPHEHCTRGHTCDFVRNAYVDQLILILSALKRLFLRCHLRGSSDQPQCRTLWTGSAVLASPLTLLGVMTCGCCCRILWPIRCLRWVLCG